MKGTSNYLEEEMTKLARRFRRPRTLCKITVGTTADASCPNNLIEDTIRRLFELRGISVQQLLAS